MNRLEKLRQYNAVPLCYCKDCLSLKIKYIGSFEEGQYPEDIYGSEDLYCADCGSTNTAECSLDEYEDLMYNEEIDF